MKIVILGGSGFIGCNLMQYLAELSPNAKIVVADIAVPRVALPPNASFVYTDVRNHRSVQAVMHGAEEVYHLAGVLGTAELNRITSLAMETNVIGTNNVLDAALDAGVKRLYNVAKPHFDGFAENTYTLTKHSGELLGEMYRKRGLKVATIRWMNAVGAYQHLYPIRKLFPMQILLCMAKQPMQIYGDGEQTIDPIDARDVARFTVLATRSEIEETLDLGSGSAITVNNASEYVRSAYMDMTGHDVPNPEFLPMRDGEKPGVDIVANMEPWKKYGIKPKYTFAESVQSAINCTLALPRYEIDNAFKFYGIENDRA